MIKNIRLQGFKCFLDAEFACESITLLTGYNGCGKSSFIQSILLWRSAALRPNAPLPLNDFFGTNLGTVQDVVCSDYKTGHGIGISIVDSSGMHRLEMGDQDADDMFLVTKHRDIPPDHFIDSSAGSFTYLSAERLGPRLVQRRQSSGAMMMQVGIHGEYVAEVIAVYETSKFAKKVTDSRLHPNTKSGENSFRRQVELWMGEWIPDIRLRSTFHSHGIATLEVGSKDINSEWVRPENTGFGISYSLPIVVAGLMAPTNGILIVDSPEAHLHPSGQTAIGRFLAKVACSGVQVFVETHSEHILNGLRQIVKRKELSAEHTKIHFLGRDIKTGAIVRHEPSLDRFGKVHGWPEGFFDEQEKVLVELL